MSFVGTSSTFIRDEESLLEACKLLNLTLKKNARARVHLGSVKADYVIKLDGPFDVGLVKDGENYSIKADWWNGHVAKVIGENGSKLLQAYSAAATVKVAKAQGKQIEMQRIENGDIKLILRAGA
ncbi:DUF1257 domain-containing protein [Paenibacillus glucanolyticus]|jgi:hypothetical protein|uniref:DUF1257 domain-containing protein n=1 Tax=Paenibacillus glucanolyticus TaxID=59843 RepID=A0A163GK93_9BACL|nr:DUF1257 domain-containing protein [Paenibacillus glucanolyticus]KZS45017.1 hypothetical protein AWU65_03280 [Paenibacillus glucanolyticus]OMF66746.1 hypothetical protein BK142_29435 [Paenibacillus glucanolyticus]